jgi:hypothetical protein
VHSPGFRNGKARFAEDSVKTGFSEKYLTLPDKGILPGVSVSYRKKAKDSLTGIDG